MKINTVTRTLCNVIGMVMIGWVVYVVHGSITYTGIWKVVVEFVASEDTGRYSPVGAFAISALLGVLPLLIVVLFVLWISNKFNSK